MDIIIGKSGNQKTPITDPTVSRKHCKVTVGPNGTFTIENLSQNGTKVDGREIVKAQATLNSVLQLGPRYTATLVELIGNPTAASKPVQGPAAAPRGCAASQSGGAPRSPQQPEVKTYNISHLRRVWDDFNNTNLAIAERQRKINLTRAGLGIFTMSGILINAAIPPFGLILSGVGLVGNVYSFVGMKNGETSEETQRRKESFLKKWCCPNPDCGKTLPSMSYDLLKHNYKKCPHCGSKFEER